MSNQITKFSQNIERMESSAEFLEHKFDYIWLLSFQVRLLKDFLPYLLFFSTDFYRVYIRVFHFIVNYIRTRVRIVNYYTSDTQAIALCVTFCMQCTTWLFECACE